MVAKVAPCFLTPSHQAGLRGLVRVESFHTQGRSDSTPSVTIITSFCVFEADLPEPLGPTNLASCGSATSKKVRGVEKALVN